jgi:ubiquinol-cytochrome c reductase cytochrome b subunit
MNEQQRKQYLEKYQEQKKKGIPFFPDAIFKDAVVSLLIFVVLLALAYFIGAPLEERADPADSSYTPRPEWYFLFLFQLLKYFPGDLEVIGVIILPTLVILALALLPFLDRSPRRHALSRPVVTGVTAFLIVGVVALTGLSIAEAPPPSEQAGGDQTAALYTQNCAPCHGPNISVPTGANLHEIIAQGQHEGMPAWSGDLSTDQIDALAGFILSPGGSQLFTENCDQCHDLAQLVSSNPVDLQQALNLGAAYPSHVEVDIPEWDDVMTDEQRTALVNFLLAPDGQRLFVVNCSTCHGQSVDFSGSEAELIEIIQQGGLHLEMPPWQERLSEEEIQTVAEYVVDPQEDSPGAEVFETNCTDCHGQRVPSAASVDEAMEIISTGGAHETMPVWGDILTAEQLDALVSYTVSSADGAPIEQGRALYADNCAICHGNFGEGGANPARQDDVIAPISTAEYLKTRDDATLRAIIEQGQPNFGMSPFGTAFGGPLDSEEVDAIVAFMRSWEANPPVELPPEVVVDQFPLEAGEIYIELCAQCHGEQGEGLIGPALNDPEFQSGNTDQDIYDTINLGHEATAMIGWGEILSSGQIEGLVNYIRQLTPTEAEEDDTDTGSDDTDEVSFADDVVPILEAECAMCHGSLGGWDASTYDSVINSGDNGPSVIPGDVENSLLAQKIQGTQTIGVMMPTSGLMDQDLIQIILDWIEADAPNN